MEQGVVGDPESRQLREEMKEVESWFAWEHGEDTREVRGGGE